MAFRAGIEVGIDARKAKVGATQFERATRSMAASAQSASAKIGASTKRIGGSFRGMGALIATVGAASVIRSIVKTTASFEKMAVTLEVLEGTAAGAQRSLDFITEFTAKTPFQLENVTQSFIRLKSFGFDPTLETMQAVGDLGASFGRDITDAVRAVDGVIRGSTEVIQEFGIRASLSGKQVTLSMGEMSRTIDRTPDAVAKVVREFVKLSGRSGLMERQANTLAGSFVLLQDNVTLLFKSIGEAGLARELRRMSDELTVFAASDEAAHVAAEFGTALAKVARAAAELTVGAVNNFDNLIKAVAVLAGISVSRGVLGLVAALTKLDPRVSIAIVGTLALAAGLKKLSDVKAEQALEDYQDALLGATNAGSDFLMFTDRGRTVEDGFTSAVDQGAAALDKQRRAMTAAAEATKALAKARKEAREREVAGDESAPLGFGGTLARDDFNDADGGVGRVGDAAAAAEGKVTSLRDALALAFEDAPSHSELMAETTIDAFNQMGQGIADFASGARVDFNALIRDMIAQLIRLQVQAAALKIFGSLFSFGGGAAVSVGSASAGLDVATAPDLPSGTQQISRPQQTVGVSRETFGGLIPAPGFAQPFDLPTSAAGAAPLGARPIQPNNVSIVVKTQEGETATVTERQTNGGIEFEVITEQIEGQMAGRAARGGGPFAPAMSAARAFQR